MTRTYDIAALRIRLESFLRARHLRKTSERFEILEKAMEMTPHFDVEQLHERLESEGYHVSLSTVYNTLELLCDAGILFRHLFDTKKATYEPATRTHLHLVCRKCGEVTEVDDPEITGNLLKSAPGGFIPDYATSVIYGTCPKCGKGLRVV